MSENQLNQQTSQQEPTTIISDETEQKIKIEKMLTETKEFLSTLDLSTDKDRKNLYARSNETGEKGLTFSGGDESFALRQIGELVHCSLVNGEHTKVTSGNILRDYDEICMFYGHHLFKRSAMCRTLVVNNPEYVSFDIGSLQKFVDFYKNKYNENKYLLAIALVGAGKISSSAVCDSISSNMISSLSEDIRSGILDESTARTHPNYLLCEELILKADNIQKLWSDILFKMISSYIHNGIFEVPDFNLGEQEKNLVSENLITGITLARSNLNFKNNNRTKIDGEISESIKQMTLNTAVENETKEYLKYINFWLIVLEKFNSSISYE